MKYPIHETFMTFQGEGSMMGMPAFFIRLFGCPVKCTFCDSAGTWHPTYVPPHVKKIEAAQLVVMAHNAGAQRVVITGGEPCIHDLEPITSLLQVAGVEVHLETSGAFPIKGTFDWIVLSPKRAKLPLAECIGAAHEFKFIIEKPEDIDFYWNLLLFVPANGIWLHPEWSQRTNPVVLKAISDAVKTGRGRFRAGWQIHKLYGVDLLDPGSVKAVPLGGNPEKGY